MENTINTSSAENKLETLINEQSSIIFDEQNWIGKDMWKIAEVTYSYDSKSNINTTLFVKLGGLNLKEYNSNNTEEQKILLINSANNLIKILKEKKEQIKSGLNIVSLFDSFSQNEKDINIKSIFIDSLKEKNYFLDYCLNAIPFELEKTGIELNISKKQEQEIEQKQEKLDTELFGGKIKNNTEETKLSYEYIKNKYNKNISNLNIEEQKRFEKYLEKIEVFLPKGYKYNQEKINKSKPEIINGEFLNIDIPKEDYILGFNLLVESLEKLDHIVESNNDVKSISDGPKGVQFPTTKKFNLMNILRFFKLSNHEIETHNITDYNGRQLIGNLRGAKSTMKDEGIAMLMEQLFMYGENLYKIDEDGDKIIDITKIQINSYFTKTLMGELLNNDDELLDFLELSEKIDPDVISPKDRLARLKRNNKLGVQHKDTTYTRGLLIAIKQINLYIKTKGKKGISPEDLFLGKISFEDTYKLKKIKETKEKAGKKIEILKPLFISDAVYFVINEKLKGKEGNITGENFYKYLQKKYSIFNFTKEQIKKVSQKTKKNVYGIVNIMLKNIGKGNIEKIHSKNNIFNEQLKNGLKKNIFKILDNQYNSKINKIKNKMTFNRKNAS